MSRKFLVLILASTLWIPALEAAKPQLVLQTGIPYPAVILAFSPDGKLLASMSYAGGSIQLWEIATGRQLLSIDLEVRSAVAVALNSAFCFTADGASLISASAGFVKEWETRTGRLLRSVAIHCDFGAVALSPDGRLLAVINQTRQSLSVCDTQSGR